MPSLTRRPLVLICSRFAMLLLAALSQAAQAQEAGKPIYLDPSQPVEKRTLDLIARLTLEEKAALLNHEGPGVERLGIKSDKWNQCLHGVCWDRPTTMFPVSIAMAATWDPALLHEVATAISDEARGVYNLWHQQPDIAAQHKGLIYRAPVINISRNPYWGRIDECYGEDPYLTGRLGVAYVQGLQGDDPKYLKLASTLKHYAVNNVERDRQKLSAKVSERMLYEYWLPHFRDCVVEGGAQSVMASYNAINGVPNNINHFMLTEILKQQWGFQGFVVSDLGGVNTMVNGHEKGQMSYVEAVAKSLNAGCDFSDDEFMKYIPAAVRQGLLPEDRLNDALYRVLRDRIRLGEFDPPDLVPYARISPSMICSPEHRALALETAREAMVLLKNQNYFLPLDRTKLKRIAVIGPHAAMFTPGAYSGMPDHPVNPLQGFKNRAGTGVEILYAKGCNIAPRSNRRSNGTNATPEAAIDETALIKAAADTARQANVAILFVGTTEAIETEGRDRTNLALPGRQEELIEAVVAANPKTVVVLLNAGPLTIPWVNKNVPAILEAWWNGVEGGDAIADVIFGDYNPAGRLPLTVYASESQVPPQNEYDITKGFTYMYLQGQPLFAFGHGLSYTKFSYGKLKLSERRITPEGQLTAAIDITNSGQREGDEVVQLYVHERKPVVKRPAEELRGFQRIHLKPGESKKVTFIVPGEKLAFYDETIHAFRVNPGPFQILVGAASDDIRAKAGLLVVSK
ncbi:MAG TPA: glycoside hydrolase family 3 C-terminal domain-containing protein [Verrucomicrobiae bacterium]|nr:glycoside hydrolase family 3 C-terminal domain-containing protein [Verrucomicrobiae bacterium]